MLHRLIFVALAIVALSSPAPAAARSGAARNPAAAYPESKQPEALRMFAALLVAYAKVESALSLQAGDLAGATAVLVIGSYGAYREAGVDPRAGGPVIEQLRGAIGADPGFAKAGGTERRELHEQLAMLGMLVLALRAELAKKPDEAVVRNLRFAATGHPEQLGADPGRLAITERGLSLRLERGAASSAGPPRARRRR